MSTILPTTSTATTTNTITPHKAPPKATTTTTTTSKKHISFAPVNVDADPADMNERTALFHQRKTTTTTTTTTAPPHDDYNLAYVIFFLLGIGSLLPWNAFITASAYYRQRFCGTPHYWNFEAYFSLAYSLSSEVSLVGVVLLRVTSVLLPLGVFGAIFVGTTLLVLVDGATLPGPNGFFVITMASITIVGIVASMVRSGIFTLAGYFPPRYTQAVMGGIGMGGVIISILCIVTTFAGGGGGSDNSSSSSSSSTTTEDACLQENNNGIDWSAFMYFSLASMVLLSNIVAYLVLKRLSITQYYETHVAGGSFVRPVLLADSFTLSAGDVMSLRNVNFKEWDSLVVSKSDDGLDTNDKKKQHGKRQYQQQQQKQQLDDEEETALAAAWRVLKIVKLPGFSIFFVFLVTYSCYPGLTTLITSTGSGSIATYFAPAMFLLFNLGDLTGRLVCGYLNVQSNDNDGSGGGSGATTFAKHVANASMLRVVFLPAFLLCNVAGTVLPVVFGRDVWPFFFMTLFSLTSGLLATMSMMIAPTLVKFQDKRTVGAIMTFLLSTGLLAGSCASFFSVRVATGSF